MKNLNKNNRVVRYGQRLVDRISYYEGLEPVRLEVKGIRGGGRACYRTRRITVPEWACRNKYYFTYYAIHEILHFAFMGQGHSKAFKKREFETLKHYGIIIKYNRAYPNHLEDLEGNTICGRGGKGGKEEDRLIKEVI